MWLDLPHPFAQRRLALSAENTSAYRSPAAGALFALVADHAVQGRVIFPGSGYLEMAHAASGSALRSVYFLQPLAVETPELLVECLVGDGRFEVRSAESEDALLDSAAVHCSGGLTDDN